MHLQLPIRVLDRAVSVHCTNFGAFEVRTSLCGNGAISKVRSPSVRVYDAKTELQCVRKRGDTFGTTWILADDDRTPPILDPCFDPPRQQMFGDEVVNGTFEEALDLARVKIDGDDVGDSSNVHEVGEHPCGDGPSVSLFLGLPGVGEVGHYRWKRVSQWTGSLW